MSNAIEYDFASVGESELEIHEKTRSDEIVPINFNPRTPLEFGQSSGGLFVMNTNIADAIRDNFKNLLLTNHGERVSQYYFGANLKPLTNELGTSTFDTEAIMRIKSAVKKFMPYITLGSFSVERLSEQTTAGLGAVKIKVTYSVPTAGVHKDGIGITLLATA